MKLKTKKRVLSIMLGVMMLCLMGCSSTIPDISPFSEQTTRMVSAIDNGYTRAETMLSMTDIPPEKFKELDDSWRQTRITLNAVLTYSDELTAIADAGAKGSAAADGVANALQGLIGKVGPMVGVPGIPDGIVAAFKEINQTVAAVRARSKLKDAVGEAQPAVNIISEIIAANLKNLEEINRAAGKEVERDHVDENQALLNYYTSLVKEDERIVKLLTLYLDYQGGDEEVLPLLLSKDKELKSIREKNGKVSAKDIQERQDYWLNRSKDIQSEINRYAQRYEAYDARLSEIKYLTNNGNEIIRKSQFAVKSWAGAHGKLKTALDTNSRMSITGFAAAVQDVYKAYHN
jgi:hypothetical protein